ncbi:hypothetical protein RHSP_20179 [Rhizobium freirei PRF 81]|uniref:Uncharacterized protein n=1 Tax=Rhizobium freirei PRF 81 TaxID=363754 RepID=N6UXF0_9HYPH|nr:hypothetical protein RHSP_20179 [Rhizobium freirei PRF 81]
MPRRSDASEAFREQREKAVGIDIAHNLGIALAVGNVPPVDHGHADCQLGGHFDLDIAIPALEELRLEEIGDNRGIVQRAAVRTVLLDIEALEELQHFDHGLGRRRADGRHAGDAILAGQQLVGDIERHHDDRHARAEHDIGRFRVDIDVEFRGRRDVAALEEAAAHHDEFAHAPDDIRRLLEGHCDIGHRTKRAERDGAFRLLAQRVDDEIDRMTGLQLHGRFGQLRTIEAGLAVDMLGGHQLALERRVGAGKNLHVAAIAEFADDTGIAARQPQRHVTCDGRNTEHVDFLAASEGEKDCGGIVLTRVRIDDDFSGFGHVCNFPPVQIERLCRESCPALSSARPQCRQTILRRAIRSRKCEGAMPCAQRRVLPY